MTNKPKITVTPDDGGHDNTISVAGAKQTAYEPNDKYEHYDDSDFLYHAIERIAELEAERDKLREDCKIHRDQSIHCSNLLKEYDNERRKAVRESKQLREQNAALAAHVERLRGVGSELAHLMDGVREGEYVPDSLTNQPMTVALRDTPLTSLARIRAEAKAEALDELIVGSEGRHVDANAMWLRDVYRKQAEGIDQLEATVEEQNRIKHKIKGEGTTLYYDTPVTSLARVRAAAKVEALSDLLKNDLGKDWEGNPVVWPDEIDKRIAEYRKQAEVGDS